MPACVEPFRQSPTVFRLRRARYAAIIESKIARAFFDQGIRRQYLTCSHCFDFALASTASQMASSLWPSWKVLKSISLLAPEI